MKPSKEQTKERGAVSAALTYAHLVNLGLVSCASQVHEEAPTGLQGSDGCQCLVGHHGFQLVPQNMMFDIVSHQSIISLLEVYKAGIERALEDASCVDECTQLYPMTRAGLRSRGTEPKTA